MFRIIFLNEKPLKCSESLVQFCILRSSQGKTCQMYKKWGHFLWRNIFSWVDTTPCTLQKFHWHLMKLKYILIILAAKTPPHTLFKSFCKSFRNVFFSFKCFWALPFIRTTIFQCITECKYMYMCGPFYAAVGLLLLLLLLLWATLAALLQGLPLAAPLLLQLLLLQILRRTIVCSAILPSPGLKLMISP